MTARAFVTSLVATAFLWMLVLSASPHLHARVHSDANRIGHTCAVTFVTSSNYTHCPPSPIIRAPVPASEFPEIRVLNSVWVQPLFLAAHKGAHTEAMVMGDTVLFEDEVNAAMIAALDNGLSVTALHNPFSSSPAAIML
jgi:hypothetical protein